MVSQGFASAREQSVACYDLDPASTVDSIGRLVFAGVVARVRRVDVRDSLKAASSCGRSRLSEAVGPAPRLPS